MRCLQLSPRPTAQPPSHSPAQPSCHSPALISAPMLQQVSLWWLLLVPLQEVERNLQDAMQVCRNVLVDPQLVPGGGAAEMAVSHALTDKSKGMTGVEQWPYRAVAQALEVIPRTLIQNCGASTIRVLTSLRVMAPMGRLLPPQGSYGAAPFSPWLPWGGSLMLIHLLPAGQAHPGGQPDVGGEWGERSPG